jgi:hypothetical protein
MLRFLYFCILELLNYWSKFIQSKTEKYKNIYVYVHYNYNVHTHNKKSGPR